MSLNLSGGRFKSGVATATGSAQQFESLECDIAMFKVIAGNTVFVGGSEGANFPLEAGDASGWIVCSNLSDFRHSTGAGGSSGTVYWIAQWD